MREYVKEYKEDATLTKEEYEGIWAVIDVAATKADSFEWYDDAIEWAESVTGIEIPRRLEDRAVHALHLFVEEYEKLDEFINYGFTMR